MGIKIITENKKARFDFHLLEKFEAGLELMGSEVKSLRNGQVNLKDSYISFKGDEAYLQNAHISVYLASSYNNHEPERLRKLLLHRRELDRIFGAIREKGQTCVPTKIYFKNGKVKLEIALAKGKQKGDKRESIKKRDVDRTLQKARRRSKE
ncbi:MAG: SsrA-binding protein SmpB [Bdellovibrionales bacterium]|nr:SsrA-binding protein SmpB [Bdellovibrionales bacterium]